MATDIDLTFFKYYLTFIAFWDFNKILKVTWQTLNPAANLSPWVYSFWPIRKYITRASWLPVLRVVKGDIEPVPFHGLNVKHFPNLVILGKMFWRQISFPWNSQNFKVLANFLKSAAIHLVLPGRLRIVDVFNKVSFNFAIGKSCIPSMLLSMKYCFKTWLR